MFTVYILQSESTNRYYIGQTQDMQSRLARHNAGSVRSTKHGVPSWRLVFEEQVATRSLAHQREREIKGYKSGILLKKLLGVWRDARVVDRARLESE